MQWQIVCPQSGATLFHLVPPTENRWVVSTPPRPLQKKQPCGLCQAKQTRKFTRSSAAAHSRPAEYSWAQSSTAAYSRPTERSFFCFVLCTLTAISESCTVIFIFLNPFQPANNFHIIILFVNLRDITFFLSILFCAMICSRVGVSQKPLQTVHDYFLGNSPKPFQTVSCYLFLSFGKKTPIISSNFNQFQIYSWNSMK